MYLAEVSIRGVEDPHAGRVGPRPLELGHSVAAQPEGLLARWSLGAIERSQVSSNPVPRQCRWAGRQERLGLAAIGIGTYGYRQISASEGPRRKTSGWCGFFSTS